MEPHRKYTSTREHKPTMLARARIRDRIALLARAPRERSLKHARVQLLRRRSRSQPASPGLETALAIRTAVS